MVAALRLFSNPKALAALFGTLAALFGTFDVWQYFRTLLMAVRALLGVRKLALTQESHVSSRVFLSDLDWLLHMSNSKYLREADFGRIDFWLRTGVYQQMRKLGRNVGLVLGAMSIRYRKELVLFQVLAHPGLYGGGARCCPGQVSGDGSAVGVSLRLLQAPLCARNRHLMQWQS